nr:uncharacterized protein LOC113728610 [Coffea arabica]
MAESTRFKTLEEQIKKQDSKLQEVIEGLQASHHQQQQLREELRTELEENNKRMEGLVTGIKQEFSALMKMLLDKEKLNFESGRTMSDQPPLLPTPPPNQRLHLGFEGGRAGRREANKLLIPNPPKIDLPLFSGENPREWIRKCNKYCVNYQIPEEQKVEVIEMYLEGKADRWFQGVKVEKPEITWPMFEELLCRRFDNRTGKDVVEEFNKLHQTGKVEEYQEKFEELKTLMAVKNPHLSEEYFVSSFISGLKDEIKTMIRMLRPTSLFETFELAILQENALHLQSRSPKENVKPNSENRFGISKSASQQMSHSSHYRVPPIGSFRNTHFKGKPVANTEAEPRKISAQEIQYRRSHGLCFKCGEKFGQGHQCKLGHLNFLVNDEEEDTEFEDALGEQDETTGNPGEVMEMSLHTLSEALKRKTITLVGVLDGEEMLILVDTGSSDSYISSEKVIAFDIPYKLVNPFSVVVGNGACVTSKAICPKVVWGINQHRFCYDLKVMDLSGWDIILGVDWMTQFSPITFDFHKLTISLQHQGEAVHLHGQAEDCDLDLIRGGDLRTFIEYKRQLCMSMRLGQSDQGQGNDIPAGVQGIIEEFVDVFAAPTELPPVRSLDHEIPLKPDSQPFKMKPYRYPHSQKGEIEQQVKDMLQHGIIIHSNSPFASPVLLVKKKEGTWRFCVDYRKLNEMTIKDRYPIPNVDELINELAGSKYKSKLDLTSGYHQIRVKPKDTYKTAFQTHCGHYEFLVMPFGLTNAPATFQALMNQIFQPYLRKFVLVFFDDILIYSPTLELHQQHLRTVLSILREHNLFAKRSKCSFAQLTVDYLGHTITEEGVSMDSSKIDSILKWPSPRTVKELRGFLGLTGYYRRFIKHYGIIRKPLTELLRKDSFAWNPEAEEAFLALKNIMCTAPVLSLPDFQKPFTIETDASGGGIGTVLMQEGHPLAFLSKALSPKNLGLSAYEKELLALVMAVTKWRHYLVGYHFIIKTDHQSLRYLLDQKLTTALQHKWFTKLLGLDYEIQYKKGVENKVADALSRLYEKGQPHITTTGSCLALTTVKPNWILELQGSYLSDDHCKDIISQLLLDPSSHPGYEWNSDLLKYNGRIYVGSTNGLRARIIQALHSSAIGGHSGQRGCWQRIKSLFYWPTMRQEVIQFIQACDVCQRYKAEHVHLPGLLQPLPIPRLAWTHVTMDFIESLPNSQGYDTIMVVIDRLTKIGGN